MGYPETVEEINRCCDLVDDLSRSGLRNDKLAILQIRKQVTAFEKLHHDLDVVLTFEYIEKSNNAGMLTYL